MPIYTPPQSLTQRNFSKVWNAITSHLSKPGTDLHRFVRTWQLGLGRDVDNIDPTLWTADLMPLLRLDLVGGAASPFTQATHKTMTGINLTVAIVGTKTGDLTDFWEHAVARLFPSDRLLYATLKPLQVMNYSISAPAFTPTVYSDVKGQQATGRLLLNYEFDTCI